MHYHGRPHTLTLFQPVHQQRQSERDAAYDLLVLRVARLPQQLRHHWLARRPARPGGSFAQQQ